MGWFKKIIDPWDHVREAVAEESKKDHNNVKKLSRLLGIPLNGQLTSYALVILAERIIALEEKGNKNAST